MKTKLKNTIILLLIILPYFTFSQISCDIPNDDLKQIINLVFMNELNKKDYLIIKNTFSLACFKKNIINKNIKLWNESKLYRKKINDYYSIEEINYLPNLIQLTFLQRCNNLIFRVVLKKELNKWKVIDYNKTQGRLKGNDFLLESIKNESRN